MGMVLSIFSKSSSRTLLVSVLEAKLLAPKKDDYALRGIRKGKV